MQVLEKQEPATNGAAPPPAKDDKKDDKNLPVQAQPQAQPRALDVEGPVARFEAPRLPWHPAVEERFAEIGVNRSTWKVLVEAIWPKAKTADSVITALSYCKARKLDPLKRVVHIVQVWDSSAGEEGRGAYVETVWPGIAELRTTAHRTGDYAGCDETIFGPDETRTFEGEVWVKKGDKRKIAKTVTFPKWAQVTVHRMVHGQRVKFVGPKVFWVEAYATMGPSGVPNEMWADRAYGQLDKCAEAAALRKAFPEEIGNEITAEEMEGRRIVNIESTRSEVPHSKPAALEAPPPPGFAGPAPSSAPAAGRPAKENGASTTMGQQQAGNAGDSKPTTPSGDGVDPRTQLASLNQTGNRFDEAAYLSKLESKVVEITGTGPAVIAAMNELWSHFDTLRDKLTREGQQRALGILYAKQQDLSPLKEGKR